MKTANMFRIMALALWCVASSQAHSQTTPRYPDKPITLVVPMAAGGTADLLARVLAPKVAAAIGQSVVIDNRAGANGTIGEGYFSHAKADGYTLMLESTSIVTNPSMGAQSYDPRLFIPVMQLAAVPLVLVVNRDVKAKTVQEFIALARQQDGKLNYASWGNGSAGHFAGEVFKLEAKVNLRHVPYKGTNQALTDTLSGHVEAMFPSLPLILQQLSAGKIKALAVTSPRRSPLAPDVPTMSEAGVAGLDIESWLGLFLPAGTPAGIVQFVHAEFAKALSDPGVKQQLESQGFRLINSTPAEFASVYRSEMARYASVVKQSGIKAGD